MIQGIPIRIHERIYDHDDAFGNPVYIDTNAVVENVLVAPASEQEILDTLSLTGRKVVYKLGIPNGDKHDWTAGTKVEFFGERFRTVGDATQGIEALIPLEWHKIIRVERIENGCQD